MALTKTKPETNGAAVGYAPDHPAVIASLEAMALERKGWEALRDECRAWARVKAALDPNALSNVGARNICWTVNNGRPVFRISLAGPWGKKGSNMKAPATITEARASELLLRAIEKRDELRAALVAEHGEPSPHIRDGSYDEYVLVLQATAEGRRYLATAASAVKQIGRKVATALAYDPDQWSPTTGIAAHVMLRAHPNRHALVARGVTHLRATQLVNQLNAPTPTPILPYVPVRAHARGTTRRSAALPPVAKAQLHQWHDEGITLDQIVEYWSTYVNAQAKAV